ncbi:isochorismatase family protein [Pseudoalteromonas xiamenensis]
MAIPRIASYPLPITRPDNRTQWQLNPDKAVLLVHDMQSYFVNFYDVNSAPMKPLIERIDALIRAAKTAGIPVVYTAQPADQRSERPSIIDGLLGNRFDRERHGYLTLACTQNGR